MNRLRTAIALLTTLAIALANRPAASNPAMALPAAAACVESGVCLVVAAIAGGYVIIQSRRSGQRFTVHDPYGNLQSHAVPIPQAGPRPDMRTEYNEPGKQEVHSVTTPQQCYQMLQRFKMAGRNLRLKHIGRTTNPLLRYDCIFEGPDAVEGWYTHRPPGRRPRG